MVLSISAVVVAVLGRPVVSPGAGASCAGSKEVFVVLVVVVVVASSPLCDRSGGGGALSVVMLMAAALLGRRVYSLGGELGRTRTDCGLGYKRRRVVSSHGRMRQVISCGGLAIAVAVADYDKLKYSQRVLKSQLSGSGPRLYLSRYVCTYILIDREH